VRTPAEGVDPLGYYMAPWAGLLSAKGEIGANLYSFVASRRLARPAWRTCTACGSHAPNQLL
jgi:hypothetical protein